MTKVEVPPELAAAFEDALNRRCFECGHAVRDHVSTSKCGCCSRGVKMPSDQAREVMEAVDSVRKAQVR